MAIALTHDAPRLEPPTADAIAALPPFEGLTAERILWVDSADAAAVATQAIAAATVVGFDTESKPTFVAGAPRTGPHLVQLAAHGLGFCFPTESPWARPVLELALAGERVRKVGFGLANDRAPLASQWGLALHNAVDVAPLFRRLGYRQRVGLRTAVAIVLGRRLVKSKSLQTSNWAARPLRPAQLVYAANDAYASLAVYEALQAAHPAWFGARGG